MRSRFSGFTLLEILVVITIIGVLIGGAVLSLGLLGRDAGLDGELQRLQRHLLFARDRAEIEQRPYGVLIEKNGYRFLVFDSRVLQWQQTEDETLKRHTWPAGLIATLDVDGRRVVLAARDGTLAPQIGIDASGEFTAFELRLSRAGIAGTAWLRPNADGVLQLGTTP